MLLALRVVLGYFSNISLNITPTIKFGFSFIPQALSGALFGPVVGCLVSGFGDIFSFILNPSGGAYFPGWTLNAALGGMIYGILLYKNQVTLVRTIIAKVIIALLVELTLGTLWLTIQFGMPFFHTMGARAIKQLIFTPMEIAVIFVISKALLKIKVLR